MREWLDEAELIPEYTPKTVITKASLLDVERLSERAGVPGLLKLLWPVLKRFLMRLLILAAKDFITAEEKKTV